MKNKKIKFIDKEEEKNFNELENSNLESLDKKEENEIVDFLQKSAENTLSKKKVINLRISEKDLLKLKARANEEGIPYQTLISSIIHKFLF